MDSLRLRDTELAAARLAEAPAVEQLVALLRAQARRLVGADGIAIILRVGGECRYVEEDAIGPLWKGRSFPLERCVSGWTMLNRKTAVIPDILRDDRVPQAAYRPTFVRAMAMAPMGPGEPLGAIGAYWATVHEPSAEEIATLERHAAAAGDALSRLSGSLPDHAGPPRFQRLRQLDLGWPRVRRRLVRLLPQEALPWWPGQILAAGLSVFVTALRWLAIPLIGTTGIFTPLLAAILVSALWAGPAGALTATIITAGGAAVMNLSVGGSWVGWAMFVITGTIVAAVASLVRSGLDFQSMRADALEHREGQLATMARELDHRNKNTLAVVSALTQQAAKASATPEEMRDRLCGHFQVMAAAQSLLVQGGASGVSLRQLVEQALAPFIAEGRVALDIADGLKVPAGSEVMLSLAFSELGTNACKYGALSQESGEVRIESSVTGQEVCIRWAESGGPLIVPPSRASTGSRLLERALSTAPGGRVQLSFVPAGLVCEMRWTA